MLLPVESLKFLADQARGAGPRILKADAEPAHKYYVVDAVGNVDFITADRPPARHAAADVPTLCRVAAAAHGRTADEGQRPPEVWYDRGGAVAVLDLIEDYPDTCALDLTPSPQMKQLAAWEQSRVGSMPGVQLSQAELVILLRTLFAGCAPDSLLPAVRGVKATKAQEVNQQLAQGKVSLSKSVIAEMSGTDRIPERVALRVPVFAQAAVAFAAPVTVEIDPDPQSERFTLIVHPGSIEAAFAEAEKFLANRLRAELGADSPIPVYHGRP